MTGRSLRPFELLTSLFKTLRRAMGVHPLSAGSKSLEHHRPSLPWLESVDEGRLLPAPVRVRRSLRRL